MAETLLLLVLMVLVIATLLRVEFFFYILYLLFGVYFLAQLWARRGLGQVTHKRKFSRRAFLGEKIDVQLEVANSGLLPLIWLRINERLPAELQSPGSYRKVLTLGPRERLSLSYELDGRQRGYYRLGPLHLSSGDLFGSGGYDVVEAGAEADYLTVYPEIVPLKKLGLPSQTPFGTLPSKQRIFEDPTRISGVRDYLLGDSLRHVNWKTSAALGKLQVKQYQPAISLDTILFLNLNGDEYSWNHRRQGTELAIVVAASVATWLIEQRQAVGLSTNARDPLSETEGIISLPVRKGRDHLMSVLDILARVQMGLSPPFLAMLQQGSRGLPWGSTAVAITSSEAEGLFPSLIEMQRRGFNVVLVLVDPVTSFGATRARARQLGIQAYRVTRREDMDVWR